MRLKFGKHKGKTVEEVMSIEPSYIGWAVENNLLPDLDETTKNKALQILHQQRLERIQHEAIIESEHDDWGNRD